MAGYVGDYVVNVMDELENTIAVITRGEHIDKTQELLYLIGIVKLAAYEAQGITPLPDFKVNLPDTRARSQTDSEAVLTTFPWDWVYAPSDGHDNGAP